MIEVTRRLLLGSLGAAPLAAQAGTPDRPLLPSLMKAFVSGETARPNPIVVLPGPSCAEERQLVHLAEHLFPEWWKDVPVTERASGATALWALEREPQAIVVASARDLLGAVAAGFPVVSLAQFGQGPGLEVVARPGLHATDVPGTPHRRLRIGAAADARTWREVCPALRLSGTVLVKSDSGDAAEDLITGAADLAVVTPLERARLAMNGHELASVPLGGWGRHPWLCLAARADSPERAEWVGEFLTLLRAAAAFAAADPEAIWAALSRRCRPRVQDPEAALRRVLAMNSGRRRITAGLDPAFGRHDETGWASLIASMAEGDARLRTVRCDQVTRDMPLPAASLRLAARAGAVARRGAKAAVEA